MYAAILFCALSQCGPGGCPSSGFSFGGYSPYGYSGLNLGISNYTYPQYGSQQYYQQPQPSYTLPPSSYSQPRRSRQSQYGPGNCRPGCPGNCGCGCGDHGTRPQPSYTPQPSMGEPHDSYSDVAPSPANEGFGPGSKTPTPVVPGPPPEEPQKPATKTPKFTSYSVTDFDPLSQSLEHEGKPCFLFFTATWCKPACPNFKREFADNTTAGKQLRSCFTVIEIDIREDTDFVHRFEAKITKLRGKAYSLKTVPTFATITADDYAVLTRYEEGDQQKILNWFQCCPNESPTPLKPTPDEGIKTRPPIVLHGKDGKDGRDGKDARPEDVAALLLPEIEKMIARMPKPKDGVSPTIDIDALAIAVAKKIDIPAQQQIDITALKQEIVSELKKYAQTTSQPPNGGTRTEEVFYDLVPLE